MPSIKNTFKKEERLKSRKVISYLFEDGKIIHAHPFKVLYNLTNSENSLFPVQFAVSVSKKNFRKAVDRNRLKRKIREAYRLNKSVLYKSLIENNQNLNLFVIYTASDELDYQLIEKGVIELNYKIDSESNLSVKKS